MLKRFALGVLVLCTAVGVVAADQAYRKLEERLTREQRHATGLDTLSPAQLELLNSLLRGQAEQAAPTSTAQTAPPQATPPGQASAPAANAPAQPEVGKEAGLMDEAIKTRAKGTISGWEPGTVFELANGQRWKVLKGSVKLRQPLNDPEVVLVPGLMGRWFLEVTEDMPKARVYRVD